MQIVIDTADTSISVKNKCFFIQNGDTEKLISPAKLSSIAITTNCSLNAAAIKLAAINQIPIMFFNRYGSIEARMWSPYFVNIADLRKKQLYFADTEFATKWVSGLMERKTIEQISNLKRLIKDKPSQKNEAEEYIGEMLKIAAKIPSLNDKKPIQVRNTLMGYEGSLSRHYFRALKLFLPAQFQFESRSRMPATDYYNAALNYLYGMTYSLVESGVFAKGLDPAIGFLHTDDYNTVSLVFDMIEPFRPLVDDLLLNMIKENTLTEEHFTNRDEGFWISKPGKAIIIPAFNSWLNQRISYGDKIKRVKDHIFESSNELGNYIDEVIKLPQ